MYLKWDRLTGVFWKRRVLHTAIHSVALHLYQHSSSAQLPVKSCKSSSLTVVWQRLSLRHAAAAAEEEEHGNGLGLQGLVWSFLTWISLSLSLSPSPYAGVGFDPFCHFRACGTSPSASYRKGLLFTSLKKGVHPNEGWHCHACMPNHSAR